MSSNALSKGPIKSLSKISFHIHFKMFDLTSYLLLWQRVSIFPTYRKWKQIVNYRIFKFEREAFTTLAFEKPIVDFTLSAFSSCNPCKFWALTSIKPDLVLKFQTQLRLLVNAGLQGVQPGCGEPAKTYVHCANCRPKITIISFLNVKL